MHPPVKVSAGKGDRVTGHVLSHYKSLARAGSTDARETGPHGAAPAPVKKTKILVYHE